MSTVYEMQKEPKSELKPPRQEFWEHYSPNHEFPLSTVAAVAINIFIFGTFLYYIARLVNWEDDKVPVPIRPIEVIGDLGDGMGMMGSGNEGERKENVNPDEDPMNAMRDLPEEKLADVTPIITEWSPEFKEDPDTLAMIAKSPSFDKLKNLNDDLRRKLLDGVGQGKKKGDGEGTGPGDQKGTGDGGMGELGKTRGRTLRWTLSFSTLNGRDYIDQLAAMKATVVIRQPPNWNTQRVHRDLTNPTKSEPLDEIPKELYFIDDRRESVRSVTGVLGLDFTPPEIIVFFPKSVEDELAAKEKAYRGWKEENIESTTFRITFRDGKYVAIVIDQMMKRK